MKNFLSAPTWDGDVSELFSAPYWIAADRRANVAGMWVSCMNGYGLDVRSYASVKHWSSMIYQALHSRWMPITPDSSEKWPDEALETFRTWVNAGWPEHAGSGLEPMNRIKPSGVRPLPMTMRRDLRALTQDELDHYRMCVDDAFDVSNPAPTAPGQVFFGVHGDWCLHYQEAFLMWHRAYLMRFEQEIGCAIPYWNWYAYDASVYGSPNAGLPQAFQDLTYVHPKTGEVRPNPLRFAAAWNGRSKACAKQKPPKASTIAPHEADAGAQIYVDPPFTPDPDDCRFVQRYPVLYTPGEELAKKVAQTRLYQDQVLRALRFNDFSHPQGVGWPWANIQSFNPPPPNSEYVYRDVNFDGAYEQPHDNYHGWVGPDMGDNSYTAFDPVFWSYHANIDRVFEIWLRKHPNAAFTADFPIHPFAGPRAERFEYLDPRRYIYTTIGDLARDSRGLGYDYGAPVTPDYEGDPLAPPAAAGRPAEQAPGRGSGPDLPEVELLVRFEGVRCTLDSYVIDVFVGQPDPGPGDVDVDNPHYVGRFSRIGMGQADDKGRCIKVGVDRFLDATAAARRLGLRPGEAADLSFLVSALPDGRIVPPAEYRALPGFAGELLWFTSGVAVKGAAPGPAPEAPAACCCGS